MVILRRLAVFAALAAAACAPYQAENYPAAKTPQVEFSTQTIALRFAPGDVLPETGEAERLADFLRRLDVGADDQVAVVEPAIAESLAAKRRQAVASLLAKRRIASARLVDRQLDPQTIEVVVRRAVVTVPGCPDWSKTPGNSYDNTVSSNFGCANANNLARMVADPADLARGRDPGPADGNYGAVSIQSYRKGETKALLNPNSSSSSNNQNNNLNINVGQ